MPDNPTVPWLTQPIGADDVAGNLIQRVKLLIGGDGAGVDASGDAVNGLDVDVTRIQGTVTVAFSATQNVAIQGTPNVAIPGTVIIDPIAVAAETTALVAIVGTLVTLAAANVNRRFLSVFNDTQRNLLIRVNGNASANSFKLRLGPQKLWEMERPIRTSVVTGLWEGFVTGDTQGAMVCEG